MQNTKLNTLTNYISASVYDYIQEATTYDSAIATLQGIFVKPENTIYNRHKLATRVQIEGETIDIYKQLEQLSKHCSFAQVSAEEHRQQYTRDAFIRGYDHPREKIKICHWMMLLNKPEH